MNASRNWQSNKFNLCELITDTDFVNGEIINYYSVKLPVTLHPDFTIILDFFRLEKHGYTLENIIIKYLEAENPGIFDDIIPPFDSSYCYFKVNMVSQLSQYEMADSIQHLLQDPILFHCIISENIDFIRGNISDDETLE